MQNERRLKRLLREFVIEMLATGSGLRPHARPTVLAGVASDATVYLAIDAKSHQAQDVVPDDRVARTLQGPCRYVSLTGKARINNDRALADKLWSLSWGAWFPGRKDPQLRLLEIELTSGSSWDASAGQTARYAARMLKDSVIIPHELSVWRRQLAAGRRSSRQFSSRGQFFKIMRNVVGLPIAFAYVTERVVVGFRQSLSCCI